MDTKTKRLIAKAHAASAKPLLVPGASGKGFAQASAETVKLVESFEARERAAAAAEWPEKDGPAVVDKAISDGVVDADMRDHLIAMYEANPTETDSYLKSLSAKQGGLTFAQKADAKSKMKQRVSAATEKRVNTYLDTEQMLDQAIHAGVINASDREYYSQCSAKDAAGTRAYLNNLGLSMMGVRQESRSVAASVQEDYPTGALTDAERNRIAAAQGGRVASRIVDGG
jgi:hypothetical protein